MPNDSIVFVGLDVHIESIVAAYAVDFGEVQTIGNIGVRDRDLDKLCKRMQRKASEVAFVYEAGPCGFGLQRYLARKGFSCMVCAPSLIARKPGDRVKTLRMNDLSAVHVPDECDEAFRDLVRAWAAAKQDLQQAGQRLKSFLLVWPA